jgi:transposase
MSSTVRYVGLDVHKRVLEACILDAAGKVTARHRFDNLDRQTLAAFARRHLRPTDRVALEASTNTHTVVDLLRPHVAEVVVSNPMQTKAIAAAKIKTDKVDAYVLAQLLRCDFLPQIWMPDEATRRLRELCSRRSALVAQRTAVRNRIHAVLAVRLIVPPPGDRFRAANLPWLHHVEIDPQGRLIIDGELRLHETLEAEIATLDLQLAKHGYRDDRVKLLLTLPGVDLTAAQALLAALGEVDRFADGAHAASYLGLVPSTRQSARHCYHGPITKRGRSHARWMLVQAAQHLDRHPGPLGHFFRRLATKKNRNVAVVATARKLVAIAWKMLKHHQPYRYALPQTTENKLRQLRIRATGERRRGGVPKGQKSKPLLPGGGRTLRSLDGVYHSEGLPTRSDLPAGERRVIHQTETRAFVDQLSRPRIVPRTTRTNRPSKRTP